MARSLPPGSTIHVVMNAASGQDDKDSSRAALERDYAAMLSDEVMVGDAMPFADLLQACAELEGLINRASAEPA